MSAIEISCLIVREYQGNEYCCIVEQGNIVVLDIYLTLQFLVFKSLQRCSHSAKCKKKKKKNTILRRYFLYVKWDQVDTAYYYYYHGRLSLVKQRPPFCP